MDTPNQIEAERDRVAEAINQAELTHNVALDGIKWAILRLDAAHKENASAAEERGRAEGQRAERERCKGIAKSWIREGCKEDGCYGGQSGKERVVNHPYCASGRGFLSEIEGKGE